jgi:hypothetical protein
MKVEQIKSRAAPTRLKYEVWDIPHGTVETNRTCNLHCRHCYNLDRGFVKNLDSVCREVDLLARKRNLQVISLLGGEPTLHPDLPEMVRYVKSKNIACQILTNGIALLAERGERLLDKLVAAGIDKIMVHIDRGQGRGNGDIEAARTRLFNLLESRSVLFSLSLTADEETGSEISELVRRYARYRYFDGLLAVLARDPLQPAVHKVEMFDIYSRISRDLGLEPAAYIPSNLDDADVQWLVFPYLIDASNGQAVGLSPKLDRAGRRLYRLSSGRQFFIFLNRSFWRRLVSIPACLEIAVHQPAKLPALLRFMGRSLRPGSVRFHYIAIQSPPEFEEREGRVRLCYMCPDATIRNGRLTPVCLADLMSPLDGRRTQASLPQAAVRSVYEHLGER